MLIVSIRTWFVFEFGLDPAKTSTVVGVASAVLLVGGV